MSKRPTGRPAEQTDTTATVPPRRPAVRTIPIGVLDTTGTLLAAEGIVGLVRHDAAPVTAAVLLAALLLPVLSRVSGRS